MKDTYVNIEYVKMYVYLIFFLIFIKSSGKIVRKYNIYSFKIVLFFAPYDTSETTEMKH